MDWLHRPLTYEQRVGIRLLTYARWALLAALATLFFPSRLESDPRGSPILGAFFVGVALMNGALQWSLSHHDEVALAAPLALGVFEAAAITGAIATIDGFDNSAYVLYYPALMSFSAVFPGRISLTYSAAIMATYTILSVTIYERFDRTQAGDWHDLTLRLSSMAITVVMAYLLVRVERIRRIRAVAAETERQRQIFALEERARDMERAAEDERRRLTRDIHDGVSQGLYMISLGLEDTAVQVARQTDAATVEARMQALVRLSKQTLLEARGLLLELNEGVSGVTVVDGLVTRQVDEFRAVTGIPAGVVVRGDPLPLPAASVSCVYHVLQEGLANVYKHSSATCVQVELCYGAGKLGLHLNDDGKGIDPAREAARGHGLHTMRERAEDCGGSLVIDSLPGSGTRVALTLPVVWETV